MGCAYSPAFPAPCTPPDTKLSASSVHRGCIPPAWGLGFQAPLRRPAGWTPTPLAPLAPAAAPGPGPSPRASSSNLSELAGISSFSGGGRWPFLASRRCPHVGPSPECCVLEPAWTGFARELDPARQPPGGDTGSSSRMNSLAASRPCCPAEGLRRPVALGVHIAVSWWLLRRGRRASISSGWRRNAPSALFSTGLGQGAGCSLWWP